MINENYLEVENLRTYFNTPEGVVKSVDGVSFSIKKGETLALVGESGCGKSTLGKTLMRLHDPTDGQIFYDGTEIANMPKKEFKEKYRSDIQMIFQDPYASLDPRMTLSFSGSLTPRAG